MPGRIFFLKMTGFDKLPKFFNEFGLTCPSVKLFHLEGFAIGIVSRRGLTIEAHHRNQPNKIKLVLYYLSFSM